MPQKTRLWGFAALSRQPPHVSFETKPSLWFHVEHCGLIVVLGCLLMAGCGGRDYELAPVSGRVTVEGRPIANVLLNFQPRREGEPNPGPGSFGQTDADGNYTLQSITEPPEDGAVVGHHVVTLRVSVPESAETDELVVAKVKLPPQAGDGSLAFDVPPEGTDQANFDLTWR